MPAKKANPRANRPADDNLTAKEEQFCREYLVDLNATQAAIRAGYSERSAKQTAYRLLERDRVQARVKSLMDRRAQRTEITADRVLQEYAKLAFANQIDFFEVTEDGRVVVDLARLTPDQAAAIQEIRQEATTVVEQGDGEDGKDAHLLTLNTKVKLHDKKGALDSIARHLGMFNDKLQLGADKSLLDVLREVDGKTRGLPSNSGG